MVENKYLFKITKMTYLFGKVVPIDKFEALLTSHIKG